MYYKLSNDADEIEAYDIAAYLIKYGRCSERTILYRPFLWTESRKLDFFRDGNDFMKSNGASKPDVKGEKKPRTHNDYIISNTMHFTAKNDGPDGWMSRFPEIVVNYMKNPPMSFGAERPQYQPFSVLDLLKFLRNLIAHREQIYLDLDDTDAEDLATEESLIQYIRKMFPPLLTRVFNELERSHIARWKLAKYFEPN
uniref:uncharacterized protein LOC122607405 n=1 Tax=Erigeron canadensis TaxID=72917 RepID=UPI001CB8F992|nr:uncharacterized protein LOC122607405 [Erigeron canadensis]